MTCGYTYWINRGILIPRFSRLFHVVFMLPFFVAWPRIHVLFERMTCGYRHRVNHGISIPWVNRIFSDVTVFCYVLDSMYVCVVLRNGTWIYGSVWPVVYQYRELSRFHHLHVKISISIYVTIDRVCICHSREWHMDTGVGFKPWYSGTAS